MITNYLRLNINKRLYISFGILLLIIIILAEWSVWQSYQINKRVSNIYTQELIPLENISHIKSALYRIRDRTLRLIDTKRLDEIEKYKKIIEKQIQRIFQEIELYDDTRLSKEEKNYLQNFKKNLKEYLYIIQQDVYPYLTISPEEKLEKTLYKKALKEFREARESLNKLLEYQINRAKERYFISNKIFHKQLIYTQVVLFIIIILSFIFIKKFVDSVMNPIKEINNVLKKISNNDFSSSISVATEDELGEIAHMINKNIKLLQKSFKELERLANYDTLTNLPNREMFNKKLDDCIKKYHQNKEKFSLFFLDLDNFKKINDVHGHIIGDKLLEIVAKRIKNCIRKDDFLARLGGDEFALIICNIKNPTNVQNIAQKIMDSLKRPIYLEGHSINASISIGIYISQNENVSKERILSYADIAMYKAKNKGKSQYIFFNKDMFEEIKNDTKLDNDLRVALSKKEFELYFQPIIEPKQNNIYGTEVLLRWKHKGKLIPPNRFISKLESNGLIVDVTYWMIEEIFAMISRKKYQGIISINLSILQFFDEKFIPFLKDMIKKHPLVQPKNIHFEITESMFAKNNRLVKSMMNIIKKEGFLFSLDDFGTGYSSLSYLKDYPISTIKIDKKFVDNLLEDSKSLALFEGIIILSNKLGLTIIVEGVENESILKIVSKFLSIKVQGYYYYKPLPQKEFEKLIS